jgi:xylulose-5-phosphate/fructose-6-phosphate phosphoketolase
MIGSVRDAAQLEKARDRYWATMERHKLYASEPGEDMPEVRNWK